MGGYIIHLYNDILLTEYLIEKIHTMRPNI